MDNCDDDAVRKEIFTRIKELKTEIEGLESAIAIERTKTLGINEEEIKFFLRQFVDYDILNMTYRKALVNMLINKIYLYDYPDDKGKKFKVIIVFNIGKETVEITDELYTDIKRNTKAKEFCLLTGSAHHSIKM